MVESHFTINVQDTEHLDRVLSAVRRVKHVQDAKRVG
jgi:(p)ppGpp synthase/HD superfamily hydrolase